MSGAHDTALTVDGDLFWVRRDFDLLKRFEQSFGTLAKLDRALRTREMPAEQLVAAYRVALAAQVSRPDDETIRRHVFEAGVPEASDQLAVLVVQLFHGNKRAVALLEREADLDAAKRAGGADGANPPMPAGSIGAPS
jgi:hypothetical protein